MNTPSPTCACDLTALDYYQIKDAVASDRASRADANAEWQRREVETAQVEYFSRSNAPARHAGKADELSRSEGPWAKAYQHVRAQLGAGFVIVLSGARGTGKTQMAACLVRDACGLAAARPDLVRGQPALYIRASDLFCAIRASFHPDAAKTEAEMKAEFHAPALLVIDEAHERGRTDFEDRTLVNIIDHRYGDLHDTLLLSNETRARFAETAGPSIVRRIKECGETIECNWPSFQGQKRPESSHD